MSFQGDRLRLDAEDCPGNGRLTESPACRERAIGALSEQDAEVIRVRVGNAERAYGREAAAFLLAAGRFVALCAPHNAALAARARRYPLEAARAAAGRGDRIARIAAETGFIEGGARFASYRAAFGDLTDPGDPADPAVSGILGEFGTPGDRDSRDGRSPGNADGK